MHSLRKRRLQYHSTIKPKKKKVTSLGEYGLKEKTAKTKGKDRKLTLCQEVNGHDLAIKDIYQRNLNPIILWLMVHKEELFYIIKDKNQVYR